jgi:hypothetical protein
MLGGGRICSDKVTLPEESGSGFLKSRKLLKRSNRHRNVGRIWWQERVIVLADERLMSSQDMERINSIE